MVGQGKKQANVDITTIGRGRQTSHVDEDEEVEDGTNIQDNTAESRGRALIRNLDMSG